MCACVCMAALERYNNCKNREQSCYCPACFSTLN